MEKKYENELVIEINQQLVDEYNAEYFKKYKNRRKPPIAAPHPLSLNKILIMKRPQMNQVKQNHKDFIVWVCGKLGIQHLMINDCEIYLELIYHDRRLRDLDNNIGGYKLWADGLTDRDGCGVIVDDNYQIVKKLSTDIKVIKGVKKTIIHIYY